MKIIDKVELTDSHDQFLCSLVTFFDRKNYYKAESSDLLPEEIDETNVAALKSVLIPHHHIFPPCANDLTVVQLHLIGPHYVKIPNMLGYTANDPDRIPTRFLQEAQVLEVLSKNPHPSIVTYKGCIVKESLVVGLCLERCVDTLYERTWLKRKKVDNEKIIEHVRRGICHLHRLGYCHNDISLANIMFREDDSVVIVDFDSCQRIGEKLGSKKGTPGFFDESATISKQENDYYGLDKVKAYLQTGKLYPE